MTDLVSLARQLTEEQKAEILSLSGEWKQRRWAGQRPPWAVWLPPSLLEQACPTRVDAQRLRLTPLGLALRQHIKETDSANR